MSGRDIHALEEVASAIVDGAPVPWPADDGIDDDAQRTLAALKLLAKVSDFHRNLQSSPSDDAGQQRRVQQWGHLQVLERIGAGSFGDVYRAWDPRLDREVALKLLPATRTAENGSIIHEGRLLARVRHPNVVSIYGAEQIGSEIGLWMEFVHGRTLEEVLRNGRTFGVAETIHIGVELCRAVAAVHDAGLLHRDIKAQNVALAEDGRVVLMDFGAGTDLTDRAAADLTGTPLYLAPEVFGGQPASVRSDVYSVGVLLHHLLTGSYPVRARSVAEIRRSHEQGISVPLSALRSDLPAPLVAVVGRALAKDPLARYDTTREMAEALISARDAPRAAARARARLALATGALAVALAGVLAWWTAPARVVETGASDRGGWIQLTNFGDGATAPSLSPDGRKLTFIRGPNPFFGPGQIYVKDLPDGRPEQLTHDDQRKMSPVFSPDGTEIAYTSVEARTFDWDTQIISLPGASRRRTITNASGLRWIGDRRFLFSEIKGGVHMALVTAEDGARRSQDIYVPRHARGMVHRSALSPDARWVLAAEMENQLWIPCRLLPFDGSNEGRPVGPPGAACTEAGWSPDGQWMYLNSNAGGSFHIWRQRFPDGVPVQMTSGPTEEHGIAVAPDGRSIVTSVGITTSSLWIRDGRGLREVSTEGNASLPGSAASAAMPRGTYFSPDRQKLYYLTRQGRGAMLLDGELWEADLRSGRTQVILPGFTVGSFDVSADGTRIVFAAADPNGRPRLWRATLDGAARPRQISTKDDDHPLFGASGDILFRSSHDGANFLYRMNEDGTGRTRIAERPILAIQSVSPDKQWVVAYAAMTNAEVSVAANAFPTAGGAPKRVCNQCKISWSQSGSHLYMSVDWGGGRTYVIRVQPTRPFPRLPPQGIRSEADLVGLPVVRVIEGTEIAPVEDGSVYAFTRVGEQRNLYRVPVPR